MLGACKLMQLKDQKQIINNITPEQSIIVLNNAAKVVIALGAANDNETLRRIVIAVEKHSSPEILQKRNK